jgi:hypothetical protein
MPLDDAAGLELSKGLPERIARDAEDLDELALRRELVTGGPRPVVDA